MRHNSQTRADEKTIGSIFFEPIYRRFSCRCRVSLNCSFPQISKWDSLTKFIVLFARLLVLLQSLIIAHYSGHHSVNGPFGYQTHIFPIWIPDVSGYQMPTEECFWNLGVGCRVISVTCFLLVKLSDPSIDFQELEQKIGGGK